MQIGDRVKYIKTHEGHYCQVTALIHNHTGKLVKIGVRCQCQAELFLNPKDVEERDAKA